MLRTGFFLAALTLTIAARPIARHESAPGPGDAHLVWDAEGRASFARQDGGDGLPDAFDLRNASGGGWINPIRNHILPVGSQCASCWAMNTASVMSTRLNIMLADRGLARIELSGQYLLNCVPGQVHCGYPGSGTAATHYVMEHGIVDEGCAPWENKQNDCDAIHTCARSVRIAPNNNITTTNNNNNNNINNIINNNNNNNNNNNGSTLAGRDGPIPRVPVTNPKRYHVSKHVVIASGDMTHMKQALMTGPISCGVHADPLGYWTGHGIYSDMDHNDTSINHNLAIVGWGTDPYTAQDYWVLQNNWGTDWADDGFARVLRGVNILGLEEHCGYPIMTMPEI